MLVLSLRFALTIWLGDIISLSILGKTIVLLNSYQAVSDLLDKRAVYAGRPQLQMLKLYVCFSRLCLSD